MYSVKSVVMFPWSNKNNGLDRELKLDQMFFIISLAIWGKRNKAPVYCFGINAFENLITPFVILQHKTFTHHKHCNLVGE